MNIAVFQVPYDSGHFAVRTGCGPDYFVNNGLQELLRNAGHHTSVRRIELPTAFQAEIATAFQLNRLLAEEIQAAAPAAFPLVLSGNCNSCVGALAGIGAPGTGVIWLDAHGDFNTPETTRSGFLDGMGLAMATGRCWRALLAQIPGYHPVPEGNVIQVGGRDLDAAEQSMFAESGIPVIAYSPGKKDQFFRSFREALGSLRRHVPSLYIHIDMDVLDTGFAKANHLAVPDGLSVTMVAECLQLIKEVFKVSGCGVASVDPAFDKDKIVLNAGFQLIQTVLTG